MDGHPNKDEHIVAFISEEHETCWGCGLRLLLSSHSPIFKCGWCGAITNQNKASRKPDSVCFSRWRQSRDRFFVSFLLFFILFVIGAGLWAVYPVIFSVSFFFGVFQCIVTAILSISTISSLFMAAFKSAGSPSNIVWGHYPTVGKGGLENYTFCGYCAKPKPPRAHHCRSCRMCVLDMDHHCPFIGNCVGAANHRHFVAFLICVVSSCAYVTAMTLYAGFRVWPPLLYETLGYNGFDRNHRMDTMGVLKQFLAALASSALLLSTRGLVLLYLAFASFSVEIGLSVLLWQQLFYIYEGKTYINHLSSQNSEHGERGCQNSEHGERGCHNLLRFFGCPYSVFRFIYGPAYAAKLQETSGSKLL